MKNDTTALVVKVGGARGVLSDALLDDIAHVSATAIDVVIVHGGSDETTRLQEALGRPAQLVRSPSGHESRLTDRPALEAFAMATALVNRRLVEGLAARGVRAFGLSGIDGALVRAKRKSSTRVVVDGRARVVRDQWTGRPTQTDASLLRGLLDAGCTPIVAPLGLGEHGEMLNVDGDRMGASIAAALGADDYVILSNVPGVLRDVDDASSTIARVGDGEFTELENAAQGRMRKKVLGAREALTGGVARVTIGDARRGNALRDALAGQGTLIDSAALTSEVLA